MKALDSFVPNGKLKMIFSSTFTDTGDERNCLQEEIYPRLLQKALSSGVQFVLVDMRYGVKVSVFVVFARINLVTLLFIHLIRMRIL
jgi:hypothetical protein